MAEQTLRAVVLTRKKWLIIQSDDDGEGDDAFPTRLRERVSKNAAADVRAVHSPIDEDTCTLLQLAVAGFDFSTPALIEFNVGFKAWPPRHEALIRLLQEFPSSSVYGFDDDSDGGVEFQVYALVTAELIRNIRTHVNEMLAAYRGSCASWEIVPRAESIN